MIEIKSSKNQLIKEIKSLYRKKERKRLSLFIVEGIKIVEEIIDRGYTYKNIIYTDYLLENKEGRRLIEKIKDLEGLVRVPEHIFKEIADTETPQGILALVDFQIREIEELYESENKFLLYLDRLQDPGNMGTIIRTADAFNIDGIIISEGSVDPYNPKVARATMGSIFRVPLYFLGNGLEELRKLKERKFKIYSSSLEDSVDIANVDFKSNSIVVIGNEARGIREDIYELSDQLIKIPMPGDSESLNAGVAASIIMYQAMAQRY